MRRSFAEAWGRDPVDIGTGGSIPFLAAFAEAYPKAALLLTGVEDPGTNAHAYPSDSVILAVANQLLGL